MAPKPKSIPTAEWDITVQLRYQPGDNVIGPDATLIQGQLRIVDTERAKIGALVQGYIDERYEMVKKPRKTRSQKGPREHA